MKMVFQEEIERESFQKFSSTQKIRLQDGGSEGRGGITEILLAHDYNQKRVIEIFNNAFDSKIKESSHLSTRSYDYCNRCQGLSLRCL